MMAKSLVSGWLSRMLTFVCLLAGLNSVSCQTLVAGETHLYIEQQIEELKSQGDEHTVKLDDIISRLKSLESTSLLQQQTLSDIKLLLNPPRYFDTQYQANPLIVDKPRQVLVQQLISQCNPLLIQQNVDGSNFFDKTWAEFKVGFSGSNESNGNYWLGNDWLSELTKGGKYKLRFDLQSINNSQWYWAEYSNFTVQDETAGYKLQVGGFSGSNGVSDALNQQQQNGAKFSAKDVDNDAWTDGNCASATRVGGGFWYGSCGWAWPNGRRTALVGQGFRWWDANTAANNIDLKTSRMWLMCR